MTYFTKDSIDFFLELEKNNSKEWFDLNRKRYENFVRKPMIKLVEDVIEEMQEYDPEFIVDPKKCLGRINRDIRFSKDKTPYNTHFFAQITRGTKQNPFPGIAFRLGAHDFGIMAGYYQPSKSKLAEIRDNITQNITTLQELKTDQKFIEKFGSIQGETYKRIPLELQATFEQEPLIANKNFYYSTEKDSSFTLSSNLKMEIVEHWLAAKPLNEFFS